VVIRYAQKHEGQRLSSTFAASSPSEGRGFVQALRSLRPSAVFVFVNIPASFASRLVEG
jgi:hypothetical protein